MVMKGIKNSSGDIHLISFYWNYNTTYKIEKYNKSSIKRKKGLIMKHLQDYMTEKQTALFNETGAFFACSQKQFDEAKQDGVQYVDCKHNMLCPKEHVQKLISGLDNIYKHAIEQDKTDNGKEAIIKRELYNYECFYIGDIEDAVNCLEDYGYSPEDIYNVYKKECKNVEF